MKFEKLVGLKVKTYIFFLQFALKNIDLIRLFINQLIINVWSIVAFKAPVESHYWTPQYISILRVSTNNFKDHPRNLSIDDMELFLSHSVVYWVEILFVVVTLSREMNCPLIVHFIFILQSNWQWPTTNAKCWWRFL